MSNIAPIAIVIVIVHRSHAEGFEARIAGAPLVDVAGPVGFRSDEWQPRLDWDCRGVAVTLALRSTVRG